MNNHETNERNQWVLASAIRLIDAAIRTCPVEMEWFNAGIGYANSYRDDVWVTGNWNSVDRWNYETKEREFVSDVPERLAKALERIGVEIEWLDENTPCGNCYRLIRTEPDSYHWKAEYVISDGEITCAECIRENLEDYIELFVNDADKCITFVSDSELEEIGFERYNDHEYENGWHPGQTDNPHKIYEEIRERVSDETEIVFYLDEKSQFYIRFSAFVRNPNENDD